jgi:hypothetical protein
MTMTATRELARFVIADLHRQADAGRFARDLRQSRQNKRFETHGGRVILSRPGWHWEPGSARSHRR